MKSVFEAANSVEAHMIHNLLQQAGITSWIEGEHLQGGMGELQAIGLIRVTVNDQDYQAAKEIIREWDARQKRHEPPAQPRKSNALIFSIIGFIAGALSVATLYKPTVNTDGIDYNHDGRIDEQRTYRGRMILKTEVDRNRDGAIDQVSNFDSNGTIQSVLTDNDFDGRFETVLDYRHGNLSTVAADTTGDGFKDQRTTFRYGIRHTTTLLDSASGTPIKIQRFSPFGQLLSAELDTDGDGVMDTRYTYDEIGEIKTATPLSRH